MSEDLVVGIDSSTQSCKALLVRADDGTVVDQVSAPHPDGTEVDPRAWLDALQQATAPLLERASAVAVGGQQHGMVALGDDDEPVRPALLWNDVRSAAQAADLVREWGGPQACADAVGSVLVASFTASKLRWLRDHEPEHAAAVRRVLLPHDYLTWHLTRARRRPHHRPRRRLGHRLLLDPRRRLAARPGRRRPRPRARAFPEWPARPRRSARTAARRRSSRPAPATTWPRRWGCSFDPGDVAVSIGTSGVASVGVADAGRGPDRRGRRLRRRDR